MEVLHVVISQDGDIGWAPGRKNSRAVFLRQEDKSTIPPTDMFRSIKLSPNCELSDSFVYHIQIPKKAPADYRSVQEAKMKKIKTIHETGSAEDLESEPPLFESDQEAMGDEEMDLDQNEVSRTRTGQSAQVSFVDFVHVEDRIPWSENGRSQRDQSQQVKITKLYYGLGDGTYPLKLVEEFCELISKESPLIPQRKHKLQINKKIIQKAEVKYGKEKTDNVLLAFILGMLTVSSALLVAKAALQKTNQNDVNSFFDDPEEIFTEPKRLPLYVAKCKNHCGNVKINCYEEPWAVMKCHCKACQDEYGSGPCTWAAFSSSAVEVLVSKGVTNHRGRRHVCAECEALMYMIYERDNQPYINVGRMEGDPFPDERLLEILQDPDNKTEVAHIYTGYLEADEQEQLSTRYRQRYLVPSIPEYSKDIQYAHGAGWYGFSGHYETRSSVSSSFTDSMGSVLCSLIGISK